MADRHKKKEITIFKAFSKECYLPIKIDTIKKMDPPEPDIQCEVTGRGKISFELVEIIDRNFANTTYKQYSTKKKLNKYHSNLPKKKKQQFDKLYSNAHIFPRFQDSCTLHQRENLFPKIIDHLLTLGQSFEGDTFENIHEYKEKLKSIGISRGQYNGPIFDLVAAGSIGNPALSAIRSKFLKKYESKHQMNLLGYIDRNPMFPEDIWLPSVKQFIITSIQKSQFEKVWIFYYQMKKIKFTYPAPHRLYTFGIRLRQWLTKSHLPKVAKST